VGSWRAHHPDDDPMPLLAPRTGDHGWAVVTPLSGRSNRFGERVGSAAAEETTQANMALSAALGLDV
jgi:hypothetical protein